MQHAMRLRSMTGLARHAPCALRRPLLLASQYVVRRVGLLVAACALSNGVNVRGLTSYPTPQLRNARRKIKKKYNYLTPERLVKTQRVPRGRDAIRQRDDKALARRQDYRRQLLIDVEEKIHYMEPFVRDYVFFCKLRNRNVHKVFAGHRSLPPLTFLRVYMDILEKLFDLKARDTLKQLVHETCEAYNGTGILSSSSNEKSTSSGATTALPAPSEKEWANYRDPRTGDLDVGVRYSPWVMNMLMRTGMILRRDMRGPLTPIHAYILLHFGDRTRVPSLRDWSRALGPLQPRELVPSSRSHASVLLVLRRARVEIACYGQQEVERTVGAMSFDEQAELIRDVTRRADELLARVQRRRRFEALLALTLNRLPEVRAIQSASSVFYNELECTRVLQNDGGLIEQPRDCRKMWNSLSSEEQTRYCCFARRLERRTLSGQQLFIRYCMKDYGLNRKEAARLFARLSETQQAALNFPFYYPISPRSSARQAYRKFYNEMCDRFGLINANSTQGNFLFDVAMRRKWDSLSAEEQDRYFDKEDIASVFPLLPTGEAETAVAATATTTTTTTAAAAASAACNTEGGSSDAAASSASASEGKAAEKEDDDDDVADRALLAVQNSSTTRRLRRAEARASSTTAMPVSDGHDTTSLDGDKMQDETGDTAAPPPSSSPIVAPAARVREQATEEHIVVTKPRHIAPPEEPSLILSTTISPDTTLHIL